MIVFIIGNNNITSFCSSRNLKEKESFSVVSKIKLVFGNLLKMKFWEGLRTLWNFQNLFKTPNSRACTLGDRRTTVSIQDCGSKRLDLLGSITLLQISCDGGSIPPDRPIYSLQRMTRNSFFEFLIYFLALKEKTSSQLHHP